MTTSPDDEKTSRALGVWVIVGALTTTVLGAALFYLFAWQQRGPAGNFFLDGHTGQQLFDSARTTVTLVGIVGLGGAAFLAYRRQKSTESALVQSGKVLDNATDALQVSTDTLVLSQRQFQHETIRILRERYASATEQLGSGSFAVRLAGLYAIASLADDWFDAERPSERQVCIDVICAYLRTPTIPMIETTDDEGNETVLVENFLGGSKAEQEVRRTALQIISERTRRRSKRDQGGKTISGSEPGPWSGCTFDLTRARLVDPNFTSCMFERIDLSGAHLVGTVNFSFASIRQGWFDETFFYTWDKHPGLVHFDGVAFGVVSFNNSRVLIPFDLKGAEFKDSADFRKAVFQERVSFRAVRFSNGSSLLFDDARFGQGLLTFSGACFDGVVDLRGATLDGNQSVEFSDATGARAPLMPWSIPPSNVHGWVWGTDPDT